MLQTVPDGPTEVWGAGFSPPTIELREVQFTVDENFDATCPAGLPGAAESVDPRVHATRVVLIAERRVIARLRKRTFLTLAGFARGHVHFRIAERWGSWSTMNGQDLSGLRPRRHALSGWVAARYFRLPRLCFELGLARVDGSCLEMLTGLASLIFSSGMIGASAPRKARPSMTSSR